MSARVCHGDLDEEIHITNLESEVRYHFDMVAEFQRRLVKDDLALFGNLVLIGAMRGEFPGNGNPQFVTNDLLTKLMKRSLRPTTTSWPVVSEVRRLQIIFEICDESCPAVRADQAAAQAAHCFATRAEMLRLPISSKWEVGTRPAADERQQGAITLGLSMAALANSFR